MPVSQSQHASKFAGRKYPVALEFCHASGGTSPLCPAGSEFEQGGRTRVEDALRSKFRPRPMILRI